MEEENPVCFSSDVIGQCPMDMTYENLFLSYFFENNILWSTFLFTLCSFIVGNTPPGAKLGPKLSKLGICEKFHPSPEFYIKEG